MAQVEYLTTNRLLYIAKRAEGTNRNRQVYTDELSKVLDPDGCHVIGFKMLHNDVEWRLQILCKLTGSMDPTTIWLDVSFEDFDNTVLETTAPR
jgi:hypothetical protein